MNFLKQLGIYTLIISVPLGSFLGPWWICENILGLSEPIPLIISFCSIGLLFLGFYRWMICHQKKENQTVGSIIHPFFGKVIQKKDSWESSYRSVEIGSDILVSGDDLHEPTQIQEETFKWIEQNIASLREELGKCLDDFDPEYKIFPKLPREIVFESISLDPKEFKSFFIMFDVKGSKMEWGFSAFYSDGILDEFTDNH